MKKRIFVGTFLAAREQERLAGLADYQEQLSADWHCKVRLVRPEKLHLTWFFIGSVHEEVMPEISEICRAVATEFPETRLQFQVPTFWPSARGAKMLVLTPEAVPDEVRQLAKTIKGRCARFAEKEDKRYRPHITLMRFDNNEGKTRLTIPESLSLGDYTPVPLEIMSISIIESHMGPGSSYQSLEDFPLTGR